MQIATILNPSKLGQYQKIGGMQEVYVSYWAYDLIAIVKADTLEKLLDTITNKMRKNKCGRP
jgi:hypothetical protein